MSLFSGLILIDPFYNEGKLYFKKIQMVGLISMNNEHFLGESQPNFNNRIPNLYVFQLRRRRKVYAKSIDASPKSATVYNIK